MQEDNKSGVPERTLNDKVDLVERLMMEWREEVRVLELN